jgi:hypothetical protein
MLCEAYEQRGRTDLADCVRGGRKYQRFDYVIGNVMLFMYEGTVCGQYLVGVLNVMVEAFLGDKAGVLPTSSEGWVEWALARHADDPGLGEIMELEGKSKLYRFVPSHLLTESEAEGVEVETAMTLVSASSTPLAVK